MFIKLKTNRWLAIHEQSLILFPFYVRFFLKVFLYYFNSIYYLPCINRYINTLYVTEMCIHIPFYLYSTRGVCLRWFIQKKKKRIKIGQFYSYKTCLWLFWFELIFCINFLYSICHKYLFYIFGKVIWWLVSDYGYDGFRNLCRFKLQLRYGWGIWSYYI